jgi:2-dehydropantoate 2-reductase
MRIAVLGAGAIGSAAGALLSRAGEDVTLVGRHDHVQAIRDAGLRVDGTLGTFLATVRAEEELDARPDLVLLAVKTQDVEVAVRESRRFLDGLPFVTLQNGVRSDAIVARLLPSEGLLSAVVLVTATYLMSGTVTIVDRGHLVLGRPNGPRDPLVSQVAKVLDSAIPTTVSDNLLGAHWLKLIMNLTNALPALTNLSLREVAADPYLMRLAIDLMREGRRAVDRAGIALESLPGVSTRMVRLVTRFPRSWAARLFASRAGSLGGQWPVLGSTLQSLRRGRATEIDYLNGEVVALGRRVGVPTPFNEKVIELVHEVEAGSRFFSSAEIRDAMPSRRYA